MTDTLSAAWGHAVQFYENDEFLIDVVARYTLEALSVGEPVVLVVTPEHAEGVLAQVARAGVDVSSAAAAGDLQILDAGETLSRFMSGPLVQEPDCRSLLESVLERVLSGRLPGTGVRVFGEMVDLLWREGHSVAALRLEEIWNELGGRYPMTLMCAYAMSNFARAEHGRAFARICDHHALVLPAEGYAGLSADERDREVNQLRQRARALEVELERRAALEHALREALAARRRSEEELRAAKESAENASRAKTQFLAVMSHELRTPLNAIFGYEDLLRHEVGGALTAAQQQYLERLRASADQLLGLVNQVLQLSRIEAGREDLFVERVAPAELASAALESIEPIVAKKGLALRLDDATEGMAVHTDAGKLRQILLNLLSNAAKFTERGSITVGIHRDSDAMVFEVTDTGIGIHAEQLERIFQPFMQGDPSTTRVFGGTGLGLSVSRHLAELLGGTLTVRTAPGQGSTFVLRLPLP